MVQANILAAISDEAIGKIFNIASGKAITIKNLAFTVIKQCRKRGLKPIYTSERKADVRYSCADINKAKKLLKYQPRISLGKGLKILMTKMRLG